MGHLWRSAYLVNQAFPYTGPEWLTGLRESLPIQTRGDCLFNNRYYERGPLKFGLGPTWNTRAQGSHKPDHLQSRRARARERVVVSTRQLQTLASFIFSTVLACPATFAPTPW